MDSVSIYAFSASTEGCSIHVKRHNNPDVLRFVVETLVQITKYIQLVFQHNNQLVRVMKE